MKKNKKFLPLLAKVAIMAGLLCIPSCVSVPPSQSTSTASGRTSLTVTYNGQVVHQRNNSYVTADEFAEYVSTPGRKQIIYSADWCGICKLLRNDIERWGLGQYVVWVNVDDEWSHGMIKSLKLRGIPSLLVVDTTPAGQWVRQHTTFGRNLILLWLIRNSQPSQPD